MSKKLKTSLIIAAVLIIAVVTLIFIGQLKNREPQVAEDKSLGVPVETENVSRDDFEIIFNYSGTAEYLDKTKISPKLAGEIREIYISEGEEVEKGQLLAKLDDRELKNNLSSAKAALKEVELALQKAKLAEEVAENNLAESRAALKEAQSDFEQWKSDYQRDKKLYEENAIAKAKFEQTKTQYQKSQARLQRMQNSVNSAQKAVEIAELDIRSTEEKLQKIRNEFKNAEIKLSYTEIRSPLEGKILKEFIDEGEFIGTAQPIFEVAKTNNTEVNVEVGMKDLRKIKIGSKVLLSYPGENDFKTESEISKIASTADPVSRTTEVNIPLENRNGKIKDGMSLSVGLVAEKMDNVLIIPNKALFNFKSSPHVYLINDNKAERREVETSLSDGFYTVIKSGLNEGDEIAVSNINELRDEVKVYLPGRENGDD